MKKVEPWTKFLPAIKRAPETLSIQSKMLYTLAAVSIYLIGLNIPLFGMQTSIDARQQYWLQNIFTSNHGTIFEMAFSSYYTVQFIMQLILSAKLLEFDRATRIQQLFGFILTFVQAAFSVLSGAYGPFSVLGPINGLLIIAQLCGGSFVMSLLDDMLDKGYGIAHGLSLFQTSQTCFRLFWSTFSFIKIDNNGQIEYEGVIPCAFHLLITKEDKLAAVKEVFFRRNYYNLTNLIFTGIMFCIIVKLQGYKKNIPIQHIQGGAATEQQLQIKLIYLGGQPLSIVQQVISTLYTLTQNVYRKTGKNIITMIFGLFQENEQRPGQFYVTGGLIKLLLPIQSFRDFVFSPIRSILHIIVMLLLNALASYQMLQAGPESVDGKVEELKMNKMTIKGFRQETMKKQLEKYIPVAAITGGVILGALSICGDICGIVGSGSGILTAVTNLLKIYEEVAKEFVDFF